MSRVIKQIAIPKPCVQDWADMDITDKGRFCQSCQKTVVDFTKLSSGQVLEILSSSGKLCGRLRETQLQSLNNTFAIQQASGFPWKNFSIVAAFIGFVPFVNAEAKVKAQVEQGPSSFKKVTSLSDTLNNSSVITGYVTSSTDKLPLPGACIKVKGTKTGVWTDVNGYFKLHIPANIKDPVGVILFIGFETKEFKIDQRTNYSFALTESSKIMGEVVITRPPLWKRPYYQVRRFFRKIFS